MLILALIPTLFCSDPLSAQAQEMDVGLESSTNTGGVGYRFGLALSDRLSLLSGFSWDYRNRDYNYYGEKGFGLRFPFEVRYDLGQKRAGAVVPIVRMGVSAGWSERVDQSGLYDGPEEVVSITMEGSGYAGASYFVTEAVRLSGEIGLVASNFQESGGGDRSSFVVGTGYRISLGYSL